MVVLMANGNLDPVAPLLVALLAIVFIIVVRPVSSEILGFPGNLVAAVVVAVGGVGAALGQ
jgi:hypothetical protein